MTDMFLYTWKINKSTNGQTDIRRNGCGKVSYFKKCNNNSYAISLLLLAGAHASPIISPVRVLPVAICVLLNTYTMAK